MTIKVFGVEAEGVVRPVQGQNGHAEGFMTAASGAWSHAEGNTTTSSGFYTHTEGNLTAASGNAAHAEGYNTSATGNYTHAEGSSTTASAAQAHAEGSSSQATGGVAHAEGQSTKASGPVTHAGGSYAISDHLGQWSRGSVQGGLGTVSATKAQASIFTMSCLTVGTSTVNMTFDAGTSIQTTTPGQTVYILPSKSAVAFDILLVARRTATANYSQCWQIVGGAYNDAGFAYYMGSPTVTTWNAGYSVGTIYMGNYGNTGLVLQVTPAMTATISWHAVMRTSELTLTS
jgi:hypothetical protein